MPGNGRFLAENFGYLLRQGPSQEPNRISLIVKKLPINVVILGKEMTCGRRIKRQLNHAGNPTSRKRPQSTIPYLSLT